MMVIRTADKLLHPTICSITSTFLEENILYTGAQSIKQHQDIDIVPSYYYVLILLILLQCCHYKETLNDLWGLLGFDLLAIQSSADKVDQALLVFGVS